MEKAGGGGWWAVGGGWMGEREESYSRTLAIVLDCVCNAGPALRRHVMLTHSF